MKKMRFLLTLCLVAALSLGMALSVSAEEVQYTELKVVELPFAAAGQAIAPYSYTPPEDDYNYGAYTVSGTWYVYDPADGSLAQAAGNFEEGKIYQLALTLAMADNWEYYSPWLIHCDAEGMYINEYYPVGGETSGTYHIASALGDFQYVNQIFITGLPESIAAGQTISDPGVVISQEALDQGFMDDCVHLSAQWVDANHEPVTGSFEEGKVYYLDVTIAPKAGYALNESVWVQNRDTYDEIRADGSAAQVVASYRYSLQPTIDLVEITGVTDAVIGQAPVTDGITIPGDANYILNPDNIYWSKQEYDGGGVWDVFENERAYDLQMYIEPKAGYELSEELTVTVNGRPVEVEEYNIDPEGMWITVTYSFRTKLDSVDITIPAPAVGQTPTLDGIVLPTGVTLWEDESYWQEEVSGEIVTGTFQKGYRYILNLRFEAATGYEFAEDAVLTINGQELDGMDAWGDIWETGGHLNTVYSFKDIITEVKITGVPSAVVGQTATTDGIEIQGAEPTEMHWYLEGDISGEPFTGVFENGKAYYLDVNFRVAEGTEFAENCIVTMNGQETEYGYIWYDGGYLYCRYSFKQVIDKVEVTGMPQYAAGGTASAGSLKAPEGANYTVQGFWMTEETNDFTGTFENGGIYMLVVLAEPKEGYEFAEELEFLIDGKAPETRWVNNDFVTAYAQFYFLPGGTMVDKVEITAPKPVVGADIKNEDIKAPEGAKYELTGSWYVSTDGETWEEASGKFEDGKYYQIRFDIYTDIDAQIYLTDDVQIYINGVLLADKEFEEGSPAFAYIICNQGLLCDHSYGNWTHNNNKDTHSKTCTKCGDVVTENHVWENDKDTKCDLCGYVRSDNPKTGDSILSAVVLALVSVTALVFIKRKEEE